MSSERKSIISITGEMAELFTELCTEVVSVSEAESTKHLSEVSDIPTRKSKKHPSVRKHFWERNEKKKDKSKQVSEIKRASKPKAKPLPKNTPKEEEKTKQKTFKLSAPPSRGPNGRPDSLYHKVWGPTLGRPSKIGKKQGYEQQEQPYATNGEGDHAKYEEVYDADEEDWRLKNAKKYNMSSRNARKPHLKQMVNESKKGREVKMTDTEKSEESLDGARKNHNTPKKKQSKKKRSTVPKVQFKVEEDLPSVQRIPGVKVASPPKAPTFISQPAKKKGVPEVPPNLPPRVSMGKRRKSVTSNTKRKTNRPPRRPSMNAALKRDTVKGQKKSIEKEEQPKQTPIQVEKAKPKSDGGDWRKEAEKKFGAANMDSVQSVNSEDQKVDETENRLRNLYEPDLDDMESFLKRHPNRGEFVGAETTQEFREDILVKLRGVTENKMNASVLLLKNRKQVSTNRKYENKDI